MNISHLLPIKSTKSLLLKTKRGALFAVAAIALASPVAHAGFPVIDFAALLEMLVGNQAQVEAWFEESELAKQSMEQAGINTELEVDNMNNAIANMIVRQGLAAEEIQNLEVLQDSMPAQDACQAVSTAVNLEDALCGLELEVEDDAKEDLRRRNTLDSETTAALYQHIEEAIEAVAAECEAVSGEDSLSQGCLQTELLTSGVSPVMTPEQARATKAQISVLVNPIPEASLDPRGDPEASKEQRLTAMRKLAMESLATNSLMKVRAERLSIDGGPSRLQILKDFADERFGSSQGADFLAVITSTHGDKTSSVAKQSNSAQVLRSMAVMDAFMVYMEVLKYEQQLRMEALNAAMLSVAVEPIQ